MAATPPLTHWARPGVVAATLAALLSLMPAPAAAEGDGALTLLNGKAGCLSAPSWRYKPGYTRIREHRLVPAKAGFRPATVRHLLTHTAGASRSPRSGRSSRASRTSRQQWRH